ncbi:MAG: rhodanese-like domain-containing protein [Thermodesulfobacteriota bacterium]
MNWKNLFTPVRDLNAAEAKSYMDGRASREYELLDVRQPKEYEAGHLPGARLIPIRELPDRLHELDKGKPLLVYCAVGGRSKAAAQLLAGRDFQEVYNLSGGIKAWQGGQATGPESAGLELFAGDMEYGDAVALAYAMEDGLQRFYRELAEQAGNPEEKELYERLASFEAGHKARLDEAYRARHGGAAIPARESGIMEGGQRLEEFLARVKGLLRSRRDIVELAMALETQALDLYGRMARKSEGAGSRDFFLGMADEEKQHLGYLAGEFDRLL